MSAQMPDPTRSAETLAALAWPASHVADALRALAAQSGIGLAADAPTRDDVARDDEGLRAIGLSLGLELDQVQSSWHGARNLVSGGPILACLLYTSPSPRD